VAGAEMITVTLQHNMFPGHWTGISTCDCLLVLHSKSMDVSLMMVCGW